MERDLEKARKQAQEATSYKRDYDRVQKQLDDELAKRDATEDQVAQLEKKIAMTEASAAA